MARLKIDQLCEGQVVGAEVRNLDGMLLLPADAWLTEKHIGILRAWGISEVEVKDGKLAATEGDPIAALSSDEYERLTTEVKQCFAELDLDYPVAKQVFEVKLRRRVMAWKGSTG